MTRKNKIINHNNNITRLAKKYYNKAKEREIAANKAARGYNNIIKMSEWVNDTLSTSPDEIEPYLRDGTVNTFRLLDDHLKVLPSADDNEAVQFTVSGITMGFSGSAQITSTISDFISDPINEIHRDWGQVRRSKFSERVDIKDITSTNITIVNDYLPNLSDKYAEAVNNFEQFEVGTITDKTAALPMRTFLDKMKGQIFYYSKQVPVSSYNDIQINNIENIKNSDVDKKEKKWQIASVIMAINSPENLTESLKNEFSNYRNITERLTHIGKSLISEDNLEDIYYLFTTHIGAVLGYCDEKHFK